MTLPPVRPPTPEPNAHGYISSYVSPHGFLEGLRDRLAKHIDTLGRDKKLPFVGLGIIHDLEVTVQLLEHARICRMAARQGRPRTRPVRRGNSRRAGRFATAGYGSPVLAKNIDALDDENRDHKAQAMVLQDVRKVLVETGALAADDRDTPLPLLVRALLS